MRLTIILFCLLLFNNTIGASATVQHSPPTANAINIDASFSTPVEVPKGKKYKKKKAKKERPKAVKGAAAIVMIVFSAVFLLLGFLFFYLFSISQFGNAGAILLGLFALIFCIVFFIASIIFLIVGIVMLAIN